MLGGFLGGLANLGTAYGQGYLPAQSNYLQNQMNQLRLQQALQQQTAAQDAWAVAQKGLNQYFPGGGLAMAGAQPSTTTPGSTPTPSPLQPITPPAPIQTQPLPDLSPLQTAAGGPLGQFGIPGGGPLGTPGLPGMAGFGGGGPAPTSTFGMGGGVSPFGPNIGAGGPGTLPFAGAPLQTASLQGVPGATRGLEQGPLAQYTIPQVDTAGLQGPQAGADIFMGTSTLDGGAVTGPTQPVWTGSRFEQRARPPAPQLNGLGGDGIVQPTGGFGLPTGYQPAPPQVPAAPQTADAGTAAVPGTADRGVAAQVPGTADTPGGAIRPTEQQMLNLIKQRESSGDYSNVNRDSGASGAYQFLDSTWAETSRASGVGQQYTKASQAPKEVQDYNALFLLRQQGTKPWAASGPYPAVAGIRGGTDVNTAMATSRALWAQSTSPQEKQGSSIGTMSILQRYPMLGQMTGTFDMDRLVKTIDQTYPNESPGVKLGIFNNLFNLLQPIAKEQYAKTIDLVKTDIAEQEKEATRAETVEYRKLALGQRGEALEDQPLGGPVQTDSGWVQPMRTGPPRPLPGTPVGIATAQARVEADPRKSAFEAYKTEYAAAHGGKQPPAQDQAAFMRQLYAPRSGPGMTLQAFMQQFQEENGRPPNADEIRQFQSETAAMTSEARTIGTAGANVDIQAAKAEALIPLVKEKSQAISRTNYPDINSLILAYETRTGDPDVVQYGELVNSLRYTYAGVMARGGQARVADIQHFDEIFNKAWSTGQVDAALDQMQTTINRERAAILKTRGQVGKPTGQREGAATPAERPATPPLSGAAKVSLDDIAKMSADDLRYLTQPEQAKALSDDQKVAIGARIKELQKQGLLPVGQ